MSNQYASVSPPRYVVAGSTLVHAIDVGTDRAQAERVAAGLRQLGFVVSIEVIYDLELQPPLQITEETPTTNVNIQEQGSGAPVGTGANTQDV